MVDRLFIRYYSKIAKNIAKAFSVSLRTRVGVVSEQLVEQEMDVYCDQHWILDDVVLGLENCILESLFYWQTSALLDVCYELYEQEWPVSDLLQLRLYCKSTLKIVDLL